MTKLLLSPDNPSGWNLEDIIDEIQNDIVRRSAWIVDDGRPEARAVLTNNIEILSLLTTCSEKARDSTRVLLTLGPSQGPNGIPRIGNNRYGALRIPEKRGSPMLISSILDRGDGTPALTVGQDESAHDVAVFLEARKIGAAVVIGESGEILGIVSERDIVWAYAKDEAGMPNQSVKSLMTSPVLTCSPETRISDVAQLMDAHNIRHMPVVEDTKLIGVVSIRDIVARRLLALETDVDVLRGQLLEQPGLTQASH